MKKIIYFDNASTTKVDSRVRKKINKYLKIYGNFSSNHNYGFFVRKKINKFRKKISFFLNCKNNEIIFTSGSTESNNLAVKGYVFSNNKIKNLLTLKTEHKSVINSFKKVEKFGHKIYFFKVKNDGLLDLKKFKKFVLDKKIDFVSIMWVNNEIGVIQEIKKICRFCKSKKIIFHVDASQAFGKIVINLKEINVDMLSISAHKNHGPKGIGILYIRNGLLINSEIEGGGQEKSIRSGTIPTHQIAGIYETFRISSKDFKKNNRKIKVIFDFIIKNLNKIENIRINGSLKNRVNNNINVSFGCVEGEAIMMKMSKFALSSGSACNSENLEPSYVLKAINVPLDMIHNSIRITIGKFNKIKEAKLLIKYFKRSIYSLRKISPLWKMYKNGKIFDFK